MGQVVHDVRVVQPQGTGGRVVAVAFFGHRQAHDAGVGRGDGIQHSLWKFRRDQQPLHCTDDLQALAGLALGVRIADG